MGAVKELMVDRICHVARISGQDESELLDEWNSNIQRRPENMESMEDFIIRQRNRKRTKK